MKRTVLFILCTAWCILHLQAIAASAHPIGDGTDSEFGYTGVLTERGNACAGTGMSNMRGAAFSFEGVSAVNHLDYTSTGFTAAATGRRLTVAPTKQLVAERRIMAAVETEKQGDIPGTPRVVYVDQQVAVSGDGSSWALAYKTLSDALENAAGSLTTDSILVAAGTYYPTGQQTGTDRDSAFLILRSGIKIYGGYPTGGGVRDTAANATVLSGNIGDPDNIDDNSVHVLVVAGVGLSADSIVLDGLSFNDAAGSATDSYVTYNGISVFRPAGGGVNCSFNANENIVFRNCTFSKNVMHSAIGGAGMYITGTSPLITNCTFANNSGSGSGGGIFVDYASPVIDHCMFADNSIQGSGGAIFNYDGSNSVISNCTFERNSSSGTGGAAIFNISSTPVIIHCNFIENHLANFSTTNTGGAGIYNQSCSPVITQCTFTGNVSNGQGGGGILNYAASPVITSCLFSGNLAANSAGNGAAVNNLAGSSPVIINSVFSGNYAGRNGGALYNNASTYTVTNCTISGNFCATGGGIYNASATSAPVIQNTIIWGNRGDVYPDIYTEGTALSIAYCDIQSLPGGTDGNISADPLFVDGPAPNPFAFVGGDYNLQPGSPALNAGNTAFNATATDIAGNPRVFGAAIDMGAYESQQAPLPVTLIHFSGVLQHGLAKLQWQTGVEAGFSRFELEKSSDGSTFTKVATVMPKGSNSSYNYALPQTDARVYYRLKMIDNNAKWGYGDILTLTQAVQDKLIVYPNPATDHIDVQAPAGGTLYIFDAGGRLVKQHACRKGANSISITGLSAGVYYVQLGKEKMRFIKSR
ncbi:right-handed parallel beta-helix repeat-containing protein [Arachidicoccus terrestris]|uniref:right-handed parallel beta-helix repeat-containing protein n=1 Tax=Arachidicoccus terrestris TaxID=2875539 RepID=UPI001CC4EBCC|nr:right-handed parallel beta-helix repeat-containing protein [Arachidicoccus terrestris]UAY55475.1 right-handed parallel beta-helix repeat-containing protein [Arachidicoccus terrestris]